MTGNSSISTRIKQWTLILGALLALPGILISMGYLCSLVLIVPYDDHEAVFAGILGFSMSILSLGAGGITFWQAYQSLRNKQSKNVKLPPIWILVGVFFLVFSVGMVVSERASNTEVTAASSMFP